MMKKLSVLFLSAIALGTVSCSKENDTEPVYPIDGTWKYKTIEVQAEGESSGELPVNPDCAEEGKINTLTYGKDGKYSIVTYDPENECVESTTGGFYTYNAGKKEITYNSSGATGKSKIIKLTASKLVISETVTFEGTTYKFIMGLEK